MSNTPKRGGARSNSGRKPTETESFPVRLKTEHINAIGREQLRQLIQEWVAAYVNT